MCKDHPIFLINHTHKCDRCGTEWGHSEKSLDCDECHTCPSCGHISNQTGAVHAFSSPLEEIKFLKAKVADARRRGGLEARIIILACASRLLEIKALTSL
jgi:hypothetical protein